MDWNIDKAAFERMPIFPLRDAQLFPGAVLPLHIFEPRYIEMVEFVLESGTNALAIACQDSVRIAPDMPPPVRPIMGAGLIFAAERLGEGRWNILIRGIERIRLINEHDQVNLFRTVRSEILDDIDVPMEHPLHSQLRSLVGQLSEKAPEAREGLNLIMSQGTTPATLTNLLGAHATSDPRVRRQLLETIDVEKRLNMAVKYVGKILLERLEPNGSYKDTLH